MNKKSLISHTFTGRKRKRKTLDILDSGGCFDEFGSYICTLCESDTSRKLVFKDLHKLLNHFAAVHGISFRTKDGKDASSVLLLMLRVMFGNVDDAFLQSLICGNVDLSPNEEVTKITNTNLSLDHDLSTTLKEQDSRGPSFSPTSNSHIQENGFVSTQQSDSSGFMSNFFSLPLQFKNDTPNDTPSNRTAPLLAKKPFIMESCLPPPSQVVKKGFVPMESYLPSLPHPQLAKKPFIMESCLPPPTEVVKKGFVPLESYLPSLPHHQVSKKKKSFVPMESQVRTKSFATEPCLPPLSSYFPHDGVSTYSQSVDGFSNSAKPTMKSVGTQVDSSIHKFESSIMACFCSQQERMDYFQENNITYSNNFTYYPTRFKFFNMMKSVEKKKKEEWVVGAGCSDNDDCKNPHVRPHFFKKEGEVKKEKYERGTGRVFFNFRNTAGIDINSVDTSNPFWWKKGKILIDDHVFRTVTTLSKSEHGTLLNHLDVYLQSFVSGGIMEFEPFRADVFEFQRVVSGLCRNLQPVSPLGHTEGKNPPVHY